MARRQQNRSYEAKAATTTTKPQVKVHFSIKKNMYS